MPAAHCVLSLEGVILKADRGLLALLQRSEADVIGRSYREVTDPRDIQKSAAMLDALKEDAAPVRLQKRYLRPDGNSIAANIFVTRFADPDRLISTLFWQESGRILPPARLWEAALRIRHVHMARVRLFGHDLSTDPIGSLFISLYLAEAEGRNIALEEIAAYAGIAISTAGRWVTLLQHRSIIEAAAASSVSLQLTKMGIDRVEAMLATVYEVPDGAARIDQG